MPKTLTLDCGNNVTLELVEIPEGRFVMGTPPPVAPAHTVLFGQTILGLGTVLVLCFALPILWRSIRKRRQPQFSLGLLLRMVFAVAVGLGGAVNWLQTGEAWKRFDFLSASQRIDEKPAHEVILTRPFYMGIFEVTQAQYEAVMGTNPAEFKGAKNPVENVSWYNAQEFCKRLGAKTGKTVRLPSEAEWEYACRAGTRTAFSFGDYAGELHQYGNYCERSNTDGFDWRELRHDDGHDKTAPVGSYKANAFGLHDMHGNVWEWCEDGYDGYASRAQTDPKGAPSSSSGVLRGGSWNNGPLNCRSAFRNNCVSGFRDDFIGYRVVLDF